MLPLSSYMPEIYGIQDYMEQIEQDEHLHNKEIEIVEIGPENIDYDIFEVVQPTTEESDVEVSCQYFLEESSCISRNETDEENHEIQITAPDDMKVLNRRRRRQISSLCMKRMCHICGKIFKYPESLRRHLKTVHSDERPFKCHLCTSSFNRKHNLTIHIKVVHQGERVYTRKHIPRLCQYCGKVLLSVRSLEEHISSIHTKKALYECDKCHSTFFRKMGLVRHNSECNGKSQPGKEFLKYCEFCGLEFKKEHFYNKHKFKHMSTFSCSTCGLQFDDGISLKEHIDSDHPELNPFACEVCHKKFKSSSLLKCHKVIHSEEKRFQCERCPLKFLKKKYLLTHILTHTGERPFVCSICHKDFKQSGDMRKHKATHLRRKICINQT